MMPTKTSDLMLGLELFSRDIKERSIIAHAPTARESVKVIETYCIGDGAWRRIFWFLFDWTIGFLLGLWIEYKTKKTVKRNLSASELEQWATPEGRADILAKSRQNFGKNPFQEIFQMKTIFFNRHSGLMQHFCKNVAGAGALDDVYNVNGEYGLEPLGGPADFWAKRYLNCPDGEAVRARLEFVVEHLVQFFWGRGGGTLLDVACGNGQPTLMAIARSKERGIYINAVLTDASQESLDIARERAKDLGVLDQVEFVRASFLRLPRRLNGETFDVVLAGGIQDYLNEKAAIRLNEAAFGFLEEGGIFILSNMCPVFIHTYRLEKLYNWHIFRRTPEDLVEISRKVFGDTNTMVYVMDPWKIHAVAIVKMGW